MFQLNAVPKPKHKRGKKTAKQRGQVTKDVYAEARERSHDCCERCGRHESQVWTLEAAHTIRRWKFGQEGVTAEDIIFLCGPSTQTGTCHDFADHTQKGRKWLLQKRDELIERRKSIVRDQVD